EFGFEVQVPGPKRVFDSMKLAILKELIAIVIAPRTKKRIAERPHPLSKRCHSLNERWCSGDIILFDAGKRIAKLSQFGMANGMNECLKFGFNFKRTRTLDDCTNFDDFHLMARNRSVIGARGFQVDDQIEGVGNVHYSAHSIAGVRGYE